MLPEITPQMFQQLLGMALAMIGGGLMFNPFNQARIFSFLFGKTYGVVGIKGPNRRTRLFVKTFMSGALIKIGKSRYTLPALMNDMGGVPYVEFPEGDTLATAPKLMPTEVKLVQATDKNGQPEFEKNADGSPLMQEVGKNADGSPLMQKVPKIVPVPSGEWALLYAKDKDEKAPNSGNHVDSILMACKAMLEAEAAATFLKKILDMLLFAIIAGGLAVLVAGAFGYLNMKSGTECVSLANQTLQVVQANNQMLLKLVTG